MLFFFGITIAQQNQEIKLLDVRVDGNILTSENTILFTSGLRKGLIVTATEFQRAIKRLWNLGLFQDIQLRYDDESPEGLSITTPAIRWTFSSRPSSVVLGQRSIEASKWTLDQKQIQLGRPFSNV